MVNPESPKAKSYIRKITVRLKPQAVREIELAKAKIVSQERLSSDKVREPSIEPTRQLKRSSAAGYCSRTPQVFALYGQESACSADVAPKGQGCRSGPAKFEKELTHQ